MRELPKLTIVARPMGEGGCIIDVIGPRPSGSLTSLAEVRHDTNIFRRNDETNKYRTEVSWASYGASSPEWTESFARAVTIAHTIATHLMKAADAGDSTRELAVAVILKTYAPRVDA